MELPINYEKANWRVRKQAREAYIVKQKNKCMWCNESLDSPTPKYITEKWIDWSLFPPNFLKYPVHLQHCHKTGMSEGAVHSHCNAYLWFYEGR